MEKNPTRARARARLAVRWGRSSVDSFSVPGDEPRRNARGRETLVVAPASFVSSRTERDAWDHIIAPGSAQLPSMQMSEPQQSTLEAHSSPMRLHSHAPSTHCCRPTQSLAS